MLFFKRCNVEINGSGLIAENANINSSNSLTPAWMVGKIGAGNITPNGPLRTTIRIDYIPETNREPNHGIANLIRALADDSTWSGVNIAIGGITGYECYLDNYTLKCAPNDIVKSSATYTTFLQLSGVLANQTGTHLVRNNIAHAWGLYIVGSGTNLNDIYDFDYTFNAAWEPVYKIGQKTPIAVRLMNGNETFAVTRDTFYRNTFSGETLYSGVITNGTDYGIDVFNLNAFISGSGIAPLNLNFSGAKITNVSVNASVNDIVRVKTEAIKYF